MRPPTKDVMGAMLAHGGFGLRLPGRNHHGVIDHFRGQGDWQTCDQKLVTIQACPTDALAGVLLNPGEVAGALSVQTAL